MFTCLSTFLVGGPVYSICLMTILACHEAGHYVQTRRYGVVASLPFFIPLPIPPIGTMGAVILMDSRVRDRRALFDIGISGPLAGLVPTILCCILGLCLDSKVDVAAAHPGSFQFGEPLLFTFFIHTIFGNIPAGSDVIDRPRGDGRLGRVVDYQPESIPHRPTRRRTHPVCLVAAESEQGSHLDILRGVAAVVVGIAVFALYDLTGWTLMLALLFWMTPAHPPTNDDYVPLAPAELCLAG